MMHYENAEMKIDFFHDCDFMTESLLTTVEITTQNQISGGAANTESGYGPIH